MSEFGKTLADSEKRKSKSGIRFGSDFIKINSDHQTIIRVLDAKPEVAWQHFVPKGHHAFPKANNGKGMSFICPGPNNGCPICAWNRKQREADPDTKDLLKARKVYSFNVLDRTPVVVCPSCEAEYYESGGSYPEECECGADLSDVEPTPRNKVQIMQKGKRIIEQLQSFEEEAELGDLREYDIKLDTRGKGSESMTTCVPKQKTKIDLDEIIGDNWKDNLYNIKDVVKPLEPELATRILDGEDYFSVVSGKSNES